MRMITPGVADSLTPHGWYARKDRRRARATLLVQQARLPRVHLPRLHLPHLRPRHPQA